jgi:hypothetical protein
MSAFSIAVVDTYISSPSTSASPGTEPDLSPIYVSSSVLVDVTFGAIVIATLDVYVVVHVTIAVDGVTDTIVNVPVSTLSSRVSPRCLSYKSRDFSVVAPAVDEPEIEQLSSRPCLRRYAHYYHNRASEEYYELDRCRFQWP